MVAREFAATRGQVEPLLRKHNEVAHLALDQKYNLVRMSERRCRGV